MVVIVADHGCPGEDRIPCMWMSPDGTLNKDLFDREVLELADSNEKYTMQKEFDLLNMSLNLKKLEGFKDQIAAERINLAAPGNQSRFPRKVR